jgi:branched-chain amino acid aminotransferase
VLPDRSLLERAVAEVIEASGLASSRLRITVTGGESPLGSDRGTAGPTVIAAVGALAPIEPTVDVAVVPWVRNERGALAGMKTTSYGENVVALSYAHERGAGEAIFANTRGELCEGTGTNVFVATDGQLLTPPLSSGCLAGITRELVLETVNVEEVDLPLSALADAEEAFLTSSTREVHPIRLVDGVALRAAPGPVTSAAAAAFTELLASDLDP